jgi:hypothetical protein
MVRGTDHLVGQGTQPGCGAESWVQNWSQGAASWLGRWELQTDESGLGWRHGHSTPQNWSGLESPAESRNGQERER